jgi:hypothetical protein
MMGMIFPKAATIQVPRNGFKNCGDWPLDCDVFTDADIAPSAFIDRHETNFDAKCFEAVSVSNPGQAEQEAENISGKLQSQILIFQNV